MRYRFHLWVRATRKDALNESYDEGNTDIVVNQGHRSNLWSLSVICWRCELMMSAVMFQAFFAPAVTLLIPHSLSLSALLSWPLSLLFFFYFIAFRMSLSHSICPLSHSCLSLFFTALWTQTCTVFFSGTQREIISAMFMSIFYIQCNNIRKRYFVRQRHHNSVFWSHSTTNMSL